MTNITSFSNITRSEGDPKVLRSGPSSRGVPDSLAKGLGWFSLGLAPATSGLRPGRTQRAPEGGADVDDATAGEEFLEPMERDAVHREGQAALRPLEAEHEDGEHGAVEEQHEGREEGRADEEGGGGREVRHDFPCRWLGDA